jgi:hypothetical protein
VPQVRGGNVALVSNMLVLQRRAQQVIEELKRHYPNTCKKCGAELSPRQKEALHSLWLGGNHMAEAYCDTCYAKEVISGRIRSTKQPKIKKKDFREE